MTAQGTVDDMPRVDTSQWTRKDRATHRRAQGQLLSALKKYITLGYPDDQIVAIATDMVAFHHRLRRWEDEDAADDELPALTAQRGDGGTNE